MVISRRVYLALIMLMLSFPTFAISVLETSVDRNPAVESEYLVLTITADDDVKTGDLDTSVLLKDFIVGRTSVSRSTQIVNFDSKKQTRWQVLLAPKKVGNLVIPALSIDGVSSKSISLSVVASGSQPEQMKNLFIRTSLSTEEAYVGQLITYKVKLFLAVDLQRGVLSAPTLDGAQIKQLGEDLDTTEIFNGRRYRVISRTYGIIADQPGELTIDGTGFSGDVLIQGSRRGGMFSFNESRPMQAKAAKSILLINPVPSEFHGEWLVSDLVALNEDWPQEQQEYQVGNPITRTISLLASNTDETSLPELQIPVPDGLKTYPEKSQRKTFLRDKQMVSQLTQTLAIVPTKAGEYTLPAITVPWWNPHTKRQEQARLPARKIIVISSDTPEVSLPSIQVQSGSASAGYWPWLTLIFALLWLITLQQWQKSRKQLKQQVIDTTEIQLATSGSNSDTLQHEQPHASVRVSAKQLSKLTALVQACQQENPGKVLTAAQAYFTEQYSKPMSLSDIAALSSELNQAISHLQQAAFSKNPVAIDYQFILSAVKSMQATSTQKRKSALVDLNP
ncbi:BatD family protein [Shewanella eurypsychrophilus]|uniref:BatD family protein n=1 Tax=Shewanella eurypsychrophilus TaxID=2593656 RepID=A0ABX6V616_9GAMM|nr:MULTISPECIES: BatD family protein [Shewanella]QFU22135.1 protein BatD [Shewanella sp. YLB-09]QPG57423.1 BatD family protein [Shewanella eurypsychrophilus]